MSDASNPQDGTSAKSASSVGCCGKYFLGAAADENLSNIEGWKRRLTYHVYWSFAFYLLFIIYGVKTLMDLQKLIDDSSDDIFGDVVDELVKAIAAALKTVIMLQSVASVSSMTCSLMIAKSERFYPYVAYMLYLTGAMLLIWLYNFVQFMLLDGLITFILLLVGGMQVRGLMLLNALKASVPKNTTVTPVSTKEEL